MTHGPAGQGKLCLLMLIIPDLCKHVDMYMFMYVLRKGKSVLREKKMIL